MQQQLISILEMIRVEEFVATFKGLVGRPKRDRKAIAQQVCRTRSFVAKSVCKLVKREKV